MAVQENPEFKQLEHNLSKIFQQDKAAKELEKLKAEAAKVQSMFERDEFIFHLQAQINVLEQREKHEMELQGGSENEEALAQLYPPELDDDILEIIYIALLYGTPNAIAKYYFEKDLFYFHSIIIQNMYKDVIFKEGEKNAPPQLKEQFSFPKAITEMYDIKQEMKNAPLYQKYDFEEVYRELKKLFILKKYYIIAPTKNLQAKIFEIKSYEKYKEMSPEEVIDAINQLQVTNRLSQAILDKDIAKFWLSDENRLRDGIPIPFPILTKVFKGFRKSELLAYSMPSNAGKSRFTVELACHIAFLNHRKCLIVSNEMTEDKIRLCLLSTVMNNPEMQKLHGQKLRKNEAELIDLKFRPDEGKNVPVDKDGFVLKGEEENMESFTKRLSECSTEYNMVMKVVDWLNKEIGHSVYFVHLTEYSNNDLHEVISNYMYKDGIEFVFYDTLKTEVASIGKSDELKKTATVLSELAQKFDIFVGASIQLLDNQTLPINLTVNDLSVSKNVKEVFDTLSLFKQIHRNSLNKYEYSDSEMFLETKEIFNDPNPNIRYYVCVVDKNRAGDKPKLLFRINLAYNEWIEMGYVRLKEEYAEFEAF